jgi:UPF0755 protein
MRDLVRFLFLILLVLAIVVVGVSLYLIYYARPPIAGHGGAGGAVVEVPFEVHPGETTSDIAQNLADQGLIRIPIVFQLYARVRGMDSGLEAGVYTLRSDMSMDQILETLSQAPGVPEVSFTLREGLRLEQVVESLDQQGIAPAADLEAVLHITYTYDFLADRPAGATLEGYLFPDTYRIPRAFTATQVIDFLLKAFDGKFTPAMREQATAQGMTIFQVVTLASIVEREAVLGDERPIIASVYLNRLKAGMPLDADPTVQYAMGYNKFQKRWWPQIYFDELGVENLTQFDHPYNTYRYPGLPPGPICSPGVASLKAVLEPATTDYYFFVAKGDGSHAFARTLEEHNANVAKYQP